MKYVILSYAYGAGQPIRLYGTPTGEPFGSEQAANHRVQTLVRFYPQTDFLVRPILSSDLSEEDL